VRPARPHTTSLAMVVGVSNVLYHPPSPLRKQHFCMHAKVTECARASRRDVSIDVSIDVSMPRAAQLTHPRQGTT